MIIEVFFKFVEMKGYEVVMIQDIVDEVMINCVIFYVYFKDKQYLYDVIFIFMFSVFIVIFDL